MVHSPELAEQLLDAFAIDFEPDNAWRIVEVAGTTRSRGSPSSPDGPTSSRTIPAAAWRRFLRSIAKILPIRSLL